ncbi:MAG: hypothetical protein J6V25_07935 [Oscillospiraceae bacterium]|nr:hypothetical protein [Oscillospiraceae bacterium]
MADTTKNYSETAVALLKADLGFFSSAIPADLETYLLSLLEKAFADFQDIMDIHLTPGTLSDDFDQAAYAAWLYRNRTTGADKTEMLKSIKRNRQVNQALKDGEESA